MKKSPVVITEPESVAYLKKIYQNTGPGNLEWDFSIPGQVTAWDGRLEAWDGALIRLNLDQAGLKGPNFELGWVPALICRMPDVIITEPAAVAALKEIYHNNGPGDLEWDFSTPGQMKARDNIRLQTRYGALTGLNLNKAQLKGILKLRGVETLSYLKASWNSLDGIELEYLPGLRKLTLQESQISDLRFLAKLPGLTQLDLDDNGAISDLGPLAGLTALEELSVAGNQVVDLAPLAGLETLWKLDLRRNRISDLGPLAGLENLICLFCDDNLISDLGPLAGLTALAQLYVEGNQVVDLTPLAGLAELRELGLERNRISDLSPLAGLKNLSDLFCRDNPLPPAEDAKWLKAKGNVGEAYRRWNDDHKAGGWVPSAWDVKIIRQAAEEGWAKSQLDLGLAYCFGTGIEKDQAEAAKWFRLAAEQGVPEAQYNLGVALVDGVEEEQAEAAKWFRLAAEQGLSHAQVNLGMVYYWGKGVEEDKAEAVKWFRLAAEQGDAGARYYLGLAYYWGHGLEEDKAEAVKWFRLAAGQGEAEARFSLGCAYNEGQGVEEDKAEAAKWFRRAAEQGHFKAMFNLGQAYKLGDGLEKDEAEADRWFRRAAEQAPWLLEDDLENEEE